jgi:hypothetical protein
MRGLAFAMEAEDARESDQFEAAVLRKAAEAGELAGDKVPRPQAFPRHVAL